MSEQINQIAEAWWQWMWPMFWQVGVLIMLVWVVDLVIRRRVWPQVRYALWLLVLLKLILPPGLALPTSVTWRLEPLAEEAVKRQWFAEDESPAVHAEEIISAKRLLDHTPQARPALTAEAPMAMKAVTDMSAGNLEPAEARQTLAKRGVRVCWKAYVMFVWFAGALVLTGWLVVRFRQLRRRHLAKNGESRLPRRFGELLAEAAKKLRLRRLPDVVLSRHLVSPAVFGVFRPVLLMPAGEVYRLPRRELEHVLLHELSHIKRGDLKIHAFFMVLQIIYWFNPLLWLVRRQLQHLRELCCDATVARILREETTSYRETILETARRLLAKPVESGMGLLGLFEDSSRLMTRLKWLEKKTWKHRGLRIATVFIIVALMTACVLPMAKAEKNGDTDSQLKTLFDPPEMTLKAKKTYGVGEPIELYLSWTENGWIQTADNRVPENEGKWILFLRVNGTDYRQGEYPILVPRYITAGVTRRGQHFHAREAYSLGPKPGRIEFPPGRYRVSYVFKDVSAARPDEPQKVVHFGDIATNEVEFDVVDADSGGKSKFAATLPNGITVELLGICKHPSQGKPWWRPDGQRLDYTIKTLDTSTYPLDDPGYEFVFRKNGDAHFKIESIKGSDVRSALRVIAPEDLTGYRTHIKKGYKKTNIKIASPSGKWKTAVTSSGRGSVSGKIKGKTIVFAGAEQAGKDVIISCSDVVGYKNATRIIAVDPKGKELSGETRTDTGVNNVRQRTIRFSNLDLADIGEFKFQTCSYEYYTFKNVSLKPNFKTDVKVEVEEPNAEAKGARAESLEVKSTDTGFLQRLIDSAQPGETIIVPKAVYTEPVTVTKPLTLKGESRNDCIFEVTANMPAVFVDTRGKGAVAIDGLTIKWQLATSDKVEHAFALGAEDSKVEVKNCVFQPLGNFMRSPVAVRAVGFSNVDVNSCRFEGFALPVFYNEGTEGSVRDSVIANCQSQGITLFSGATVDIVGNIITGSNKHAVRNTGGTLRMHDNLVINNANRGVYLGNKSAHGTISNNVIMGNGTGISAFARSKVKIENNVLLNNDFAGIDMRDSCFLSIQNNIVLGSPRGLALFKETGKDNNKIDRNTFWQNAVDAENFKEAFDSIAAEPGFVDAANGNFSLKEGPVLEHNQGLTNPEIFKTLWKKWQSLSQE